MPRCAALLVLASLSPTSSLLLQPSRRSALTRRGRDSAARAVAAGIRSEQGEALATATVPRACAARPSTLPPSHRALVVTGPRFAPHGHRQLFLSSHRRRRQQKRHCRRPSNEGHARAGLPPRPPLTARHPQPSGDRERGQASDEGVQVRAAARAGRQRGDGAWAARSSSHPDDAAHLSAVALDRGTRSRLAPSRPARRASSRRTSSRRARRSRPLTLRTRRAPPGSPRRRPPRWRAARSRSGRRRSRPSRGASCPTTRRRLRRTPRRTGA